MSKWVLFVLFFVTFGASAFSAEKLTCSSQVQDSSPILVVDLNIPAEGEENWAIPPSFIQSKTKLGKKRNIVFFVDVDSAKKEVTLSLGDGDKTYQETGTSFAVNLSIAKVVHAPYTLGTKYSVQMGGFGSPDVELKILCQIVKRTDLE